MGKFHQCLTELSALDMIIAGYYSLRFCFYLTLTPMINFFSCTPFISEHRFLHNAVTLIADIRHIVMTLMWHLMTPLHSVR